MDFKDNLDHEPQIYVLFDPFFVLLSQIEYWLLIFYNFVYPINLIIAIHTDCFMLVFSFN